MYIFIFLKNKKIDKTSYEAHHTVEDVGYRYVKLFENIFDKVLKDKYPNFEVELKCILTVNPYLLVCSYIKWKSDVNK